MQQALAPPIHKCRRCCVDTLSSPFISPHWLHLSPLCAVRPLDHAVLGSDNSKRVPGSHAAYRNIARELRVSDSAAIARELQLGAGLGDCEGLTRMAWSGLRLASIRPSEVRSRFVRAHRPQEKTCGGDRDQNGLVQHHFLLSCSRVPKGSKPSMGDVRRALGRTPPDQVRLQITSSWTCRWVGP